MISAYGNDAILVPPVCTVTVTETGLSDGVKQAVANCVSGYQGSECTYKNEWALLGRVRALSVRRAGPPEMPIFGTMWPAWNRQ